MPFSSRISAYILSTTTGILAFTILEASNSYNLTDIFRFMGIIKYYISLSTLNKSVIKWIFAAFAAVAR